MHNTALLFNARTLERGFSGAQVGFDAISEWLSDTLLSLNANKTIFLKFSMYKPKAFSVSTAPSNTLDENLNCYIAY